MAFAAACSGQAARPDADLVRQARDLFGALPAVMASADNPVTPAKVALGKTLFYESRISVDGTVSCARCHPLSLYAVDGLPKSVGNRCRTSPRNAPTVLNAAAQIAAHWVGNRTSVEDQARQALVGAPSFGMPSYEAAEARLKGIPGYEPLFRKAFPGEPEPVTVGNFALAVGAFERTLVTPAPFDAFLDGDRSALDDGQKAGLKDFIETGCANCHSGAYFGGRSYQKFGVVEPYWKRTVSPEIDEGRYGVTKNEADKYVFKVPVLRNVQMTSPYFHDGSVGRLSDAVWIMGKVQLGIDLAEARVKGIVLFLQALTGRDPGRGARGAHPAGIGSRGRRGPDPAPDPDPARGALAERGPHAGTRPLEPGPARLRGDRPPPGKRRPPRSGRPRAGGPDHPALHRGVPRKARRGARLPPLRKAGAARRPGERPSRAAPRGPRPDREDHRARDGRRFQRSGRASEARGRHPRLHPDVQAARRPRRLRPLPGLPRTPSGRRSSSRSARSSKPRSTRSWAPKDSRARSPSSPSWRRRWGSAISRGTRRLKS